MHQGQILVADRTCIRAGYWILTGNVLRLDTGNLQNMDQGWMQATDRTCIRARYYCRY